MANQRKTIDLSVFQGEARRVRVVIKTPVLGELTTRTNSSNCVITYESGSIIPTVGESYELRWSGGRRQRMTAASATGQAVTFTGGTGSPLPATGESISITGFTEPKNIAGWDAQCLVRTKQGTVVGTFEVGASEDADGGPITITDASGLIDLVFNETWTAAADDGFLRYDLLVTPDDRRPFFPFGGNLHLQARGNSSPAFDSDAEVTVNLDQDVVIEFAEGLPGESGAGGGGGGSGTVTSITLTQPAAGLTITGSGTAITTSGTRTFALANDLAALEALSGTNTIYYREASDKWTAVTIGSSLSFSGGILDLGSTPALGTPVSGNFSTGTFTWPTFNQNTTGTAAVASAVTTANEASDTTCFVAFVNASGSANQAVKVNTGFTFNASTGAVGMTSLVLGGTLSATGYSITKAGAATFDSLTVTGSNAATFGLYTITLGGNSTIDQDVSTTANPTFNDLTVSGNLTVNGTTTTFNTATVEVEDSLMELAVGNTANSLDSGWYANYQTAATPLYLGFFWDASALKFRCFTGLQSEPTTTVNIAGTGYTTGTLVANTEGTHDGVIGGTTPAAGTFTTLVAGSTTSLLLGTAGSAVGNIGFRNATSGTITLAPTTGALGTVTQTLQAVSGTIYCTGGTDVSVADGGTGLSSGTSGGIPYFSGTTTIASSGALTANALMIGGGAGSAPSTTTTGTGVLTQLGLAADGSDVDAIGLRGIPQGSKSADYTLALSDTGKSIYHPSSDANSRTFTIPANASVAFEIGSTITIINDSANSCTIAITSDTLVWTPTGGTGSRTLAQYGVATITKVTSTRWYITGSGLT